MMLDMQGTTDPHDSVCADFRFAPHIRDERSRNPVVEGLAPGPLGGPVNGHAVAVDSF